VNANEVSGTEPASADSGRWVLVATILGSSMVFIDSSVVNVALPTIQEDLGATAAATQWFVESYALGLAALVLAGGALGDRFGRRRLFILGTVLFTLTSVWCGLARDPATLIAARAAQGIAGALLTPTSLAIITATFDDEKERGRAIGTWSGFTAITTAIGPVLGGWLVDNASWRWIFFINLPFAIAILALAWTRVPESRDPAVTRIDWWGALLATTGLGGVVFGLIEAPTRGWTDPIVIGSLVAGIVALAGFVIVEHRIDQPMMPLGLFRSRTFSGANLLTLFLYAALGGALYFFPFLLIQVQGYGSTGAGAALLPLVLLMFALSRWSGGLISTFGAKLPLVVGPIVAAIGFGLFTVPGLGGSYWTTWFPAVTVLGLGMAITVAPLTTAVMGAVDEHRAGIASGINNAVSRTASLLAIAVMGVAVSIVFTRQLDTRLDDAALDPEIAEAVRDQGSDLAAAQAPSGVDDDARAEIEGIIDRSFISAFRVVMWIAAGLALASAACAWVLINGRKRTPGDPRGSPGDS
jgi:EmrB/QacA subfamily drug resistance transporter